MKQIDNYIRYPAACPVCGVKPGIPCKSLFTGKRVHTHKDRPQLREGIMDAIMATCKIPNCDRTFLKVEPLRILCGNSLYHCLVSPRT